jgi:hypothetical protein
MWSGAIEPRRNGFPAASDTYGRSGSSSMGKSRGIAATAASALIFSTLLISNLALVSSSQDRQRLYSQADAGDTLFDQSMAAAASAEAKALLRAEASIGTTVMDCRTAGATVAAMISGISIVENAGNVSVMASTDRSASETSYDDHSLSPFDGFISGTVNIPVSIYAFGSSDGVQFTTNFVVPTHLPVRIETAVADCVSTVKAIEAALSESVLRSCNATMIESVLRGVSSESASMTARDRLDYGFSYVLANSDPCEVLFVVTIEQTGINGPGGIFSLRLREDGSAYGFPSHQQLLGSMKRTVPE